MFLCPVGRAIGCEHTAMFRILFGTVIGFYALLVGLLVASKKIALWIGVPFLCPVGRAIGCELTS